MLKAWIVAAAFAVAPLGGCASLNATAGAITDREIATLDPGALQGADIDIIAYAGAGAWRAVQAEAARLAELDQTPTRVKAAIVRADRIGTPLVIELTRLAEAYGALKSLGDDGVEEREAIATEIEKLVPRAQANTRELALIVTAAAQSNEGGGQ